MRVRFSVGLETLQSEIPPSVNLAPTFELANEVSMEGFENAKQQAVEDIFVAKSRSLSFM